MYTVKEIFYTLQGEGFHAGRPAVFCRFAGCNLWTGREEDRSSAVCTFCDTDFVGVGPDGGKFATADELADSVARQWPSGVGGRPYVVCTGGEPLLHRELPEIVKGFLARKKYVIVCTNALLLAKKIDDYKPHPSFTWSIHLDGKIGRAHV